MKTNKEITVLWPRPLGKIKTSGDAPMKMDKEITVLWQGLVVGALFASLTFILWAFCTAIIYYYFSLAQLQPLFGFLSAAVLAVLLIGVSIKFSGKLRPY